MGIKLKAFVGHEARGRGGGDIEPLNRQNQRARSFQVDRARKRGRRHRSEKQDVRGWKRSGGSKEDGSLGGGAPSRRATRGAGVQLNQRNQASTVERSGAITTHREFKCSGPVDTLAEITALEHTKSDGRQLHGYEKTSDGIEEAPLSVLSISERRGNVMRSCSPEIEPLNEDF